MPVSAQEQRQLLEQQFNLFYPLLDAEERGVLDDIYSQEFEKLSQITAAPEHSSDKQLDKFIADLQARAHEEQVLTLDAWIEGKLTPFKVMFVSQEPVSAEWLNEGLRRSEWDKFNTVAVQALPPLTEDDVLPTVHGLIVLTQGELHPHTDRLMQKAVQLGLRTFVLNMKTARIRKSRANCQV